MIGQGVKLMVGSLVIVLIFIALIPIIANGIADLSTNANISGATLVLISLFVLFIALAVLFIILKGAGINVGLSGK